MTEQLFYISQVIHKKLQGTLDAEEEKALTSWLSEKPANHQLYDELANEAYVKAELEKFSSYDEEGVKGCIQTIIQSVPEQKTTAKLVNWRRLVAAASVMIALGVGSYFVFFKKSTSGNQVAITQPKSPADIAAPENNRATVTLSNGQKIYLDSAANGQLTVQGNVKLVKLANGQIAYQNADGTVSNELQYNTLDNPRGSKVIDMQLADGSHVWLNAGSSITYPIPFVGNERKVTITGEAYFEIAHDASKPFKVGKGDIEVTVLGTHFNVNTYDDEDNIKVTLLQGSVKVANAQGAATIQPGQQAVIIPNLKPEARSDVDLHAVMAWKNGLFQFDGASLPELMRQIARWYDVQISYESNIPLRKFGGKIPRSSNLSQVLKVLEESKIHFKIEGKKLTIRP